MTQLSPAAQAIVKAFDDRYELLGPLEDYWQEQCLAAAIRAAVDQAIPMTKTPWGSTLVPVLTAQESHERILAIADELEAQ